MSVAKQLQQLANSSFQSNLTLCPSLEALRPKYIELCGEIIAKGNFSRAQDCNAHIQAKFYSSVAGQKNCAQLLGCIRSRLPQILSAIESIDVELVPAFQVDLQQLLADNSTKRAMVSELRFYSGRISPRSSPRPQFQPFVGKRASNIHLPHFSSSHSTITDSDTSSTCRSDSFDSDSSSEPSPRPQIHTKHVNIIQ